MNISEMDIDVTAVEKYRFTTDCKQEKSYLLRDLLPYDLSSKTGKNLKDRLREYRFLLLITQESIHHLKNKNLDKFDSLVGENSCQIRSVKIALIALNTAEFEFANIEIRIEEVLNKIDEILMSNNNEKTLLDIIQDNGLDVSLSVDEFFSVQSFLLSEMKECKSNGNFFTSILRSERCSPSMLQKRYPQISYTFLDKLAKKIRPLLASYSVDFVREAAEELKNPLLKKMSGKEYELIHNSLSCIPTFYSFKTLLFLIQKKEIPIIFHVKFLKKTEHGYIVEEEDFLYFSTDFDGNYIKRSPGQEDLEKPACIIQGAVCLDVSKNPLSKEQWEEKLTSYSPIEALLAFSADHPQYPNHDYPILINDPEYYYYQKLAKDKGFSLCNPITFFPQHMYTIKVGSIFTYPEKKKTACAEIK
jgi:hypothetical protein